MERICELVRDGAYDDEIARILTQEGHHSPWEADKVLPITVRRIRLKHRLKVRHRTRWPAVADHLTVTQLAQRLRIPVKWIYVQLKRGSILTTREASGRFLFPDNTIALQATVKLSFAIGLAPRKQKLFRKPMMPCCRRHRRGPEKLSSTIRSFSAADQRRRRPVSTISRRRTWRLSVRISIPTVSYRPDKLARRPSSDEYDRTTTLIRAAEARGSD